MNNKKILTIILIILVIGFVVEKINVNKTNIYEEQNKSSIKKNKNLLSMNLEQTAGAGDYKTVTQSEWPTEGYIFNTELSRCENGSELSWDDTKKVVVVSGNLSDKCYVYFDLIPSMTLAEYVISQYTGIQGENGIYYHNSSLENGAGDNSYRYAGANPNNFVCFGTNESPCATDNLYRIIGVFGENYHGVSGKQLAKLIKYDYANSDLLGIDGDYAFDAGIAASSAPNASYYKGSLTTINTYHWNYYADTSDISNTWSTSLLNKINLNTNYITNIGSTWSNKIVTTTWKVGGNTYANIKDVVPATAYQNEIVSPNPTNSKDNATIYEAKIGLMYVSDYGFGAIPEVWTTTLYNYDGSVNDATIRSHNWIYMGYYDWTISRIADTSGRVFNIDYLGGVRFGGNIQSMGVYYVYGVRPTFFLEPSVTYVRGTGTMNDPIRIN